MQINEKDFVKYLTISKGLAKKSIKTYLTRFRLINRWLEQNNRTLSKATIEDFLYQKKEQGFTNSTINTYIQALNHVSGCYKFHDLEGNFMEGINGLAKKRTNIVPLSKDEVNRLLQTNLAYLSRNGVSCKNLDLTYLTFTEFLIFTACRYDEAASLRVGELDIDNHRATLLETKNKENRYAYYNGPIVEHLRMLINGKTPNDLVFTNSKGGKMHSGDFGSNLKRRAIKAGITKKIHPHLLRHTYASQYYNYTHDIAMVATILGHKDIQTTYDTYVHMDTEAIQQATNRHPLMAPYIKPEEVLTNIKGSIDNLKIGDDKRLEYKVAIENNELILKVKIISPTG